MRTHSIQICIGLVWVLPENTKVHHEDARLLKVYTCFRNHKALFLISELSILFSRGVFIAGARLTFEVTIVVDDRTFLRRVKANGTKKSVHPRSLRKFSCTLSRPFQKCTLGVRQCDRRAVRARSPYNDQSGRTLRKMFLNHVVWLTEGKQECGKSEET